MAFRVLNVAEKNDAAKELARIMSRGTNSRREGFSRFNKVYEFQYSLLNRRCEMIMTSVSGHLMGLEFAFGYQKWYSCPPSALFHAPVEKQVSKNMADIKRTLEREVRGCNALVIWTDCDREGENIGFEIIEICRKIKPRIDVFRARFSEITANSITRACSTLTTPDQLTSFAVDVRQELDLRIGAAFTRFQTLRLQKRFPEVLNDQLVSYGSCQFPTLGFVVQRFKEIVAFVAETFFKIKVVHATQEGEVEFVWNRVQVFHQLACTALHQMCLNNPLASVINQSSKPKSKWRPLPLDTVELEKLASRKLKINAKETMRIAEKLYNQGLISYPRTETNIFPSSLDLNNLIQQQMQDEHWGEFATYLLADGAQPRQGTKTDNAHPPIHPTKHTRNLQGNEQRLYEFIVRHFLACCSKDAQGVETMVEIEIAGEQFKAKGLAVTAKNYLNVYPYERWSDKTLPVYHTGDTFMPTSIDMVDGHTQPPSLLTEADLIVLMEKHGIGTDATHAEHIETIKSRHYVGVQLDGTFVPGELGMGLVEGYDAMGFEMSKPYLRAELESDLKRICLGQKQKDVVLQQQIQKYHEVFEKTCEHVMQLDQALSNYFGQPTELAEDPIPAQVMSSDPVFACYICGSHPMYIKKTREQRFMMGCMGYPKCTSRVFFPSFVLNAQAAETICQRCVPQPVLKIKFQFKRGSVPPMMALEYTGCIKCDEMLQEVLNVRMHLKQSSAGNQRVAHYSNQTRNNKSQRTTGRRSQQQLNQITLQAEHHLPQGSSLLLTNILSSHDSGCMSNSITEDSTSQVVCICGQNAVKLTVQKQGPNTGRQFYKCAKRENSCSFFLWVDSATRQPSNDQIFSNRLVSSCRRRTSAGADEVGVLCQCQQLAAMRTVQKAGPNLHKQFFCCAKHRTQSCNFFEWVNSEAQNSIHKSTYQAPIRKIRCCGVCRQPGHTRNKCPRR